MGDTSKGFKKRGVAEGSSLGIVTPAEPKPKPATKQGDQQ